MTQPIEYDPNRHDPPPVLDVHRAALQEIDRVVGNKLTLDEDDTTRLRGILFAALSEAHLRKQNPPAQP
ncbi:hypothetical protein JNW88_00350 [Micromonospora sp. ATA32]|nr:hypothetical protein [Micromonospora sp. ATA32]